MRSTAIAAWDSPPSDLLKKSICLSVGVDSLTVQETSTPSFCTVYRPRLVPIFAW